MQKFTQKYTIVSLLEDVKEGYEYSSNKWPLHVSIADTFAIKWDINEFIKKLTELSMSLKIVSSTMSHYEYFGPDQQTQVAILESNKGLTALHYEVIGLLKKAGVIFNDPQYTESGFRAHSTVQPHARINIGETVSVNNIALVDMYPNEDAYQRKILKIIKLSD
jgi:hypothetical protein